MKREAKVAIMCAILIASCNSGRRNGESTVRGHLSDSTSGSFIPKDSANKMITSYLTSINYSQNDTSLQSISINVNQLRRYIDSMPGSDTIANIKLMFAHTLNYINSGQGGHFAGYTSGKLTLIISAYSSSGNYIYHSGDVIDNGAPCPTNCPPGNAANPLLQ